MKVCDEVQYLIYTLDRWTVLVLQKVPAESLWQCGRFYSFVISLLNEFILEFRLYFTYPISRVESKVLYPNISRDLWKMLNFVQVQGSRKF